MGYSTVIGSIGINHIVVALLVLTVAATVLIMALWARGKIVLSASVTWRFWFYALILEAVAFFGYAVISLMFVGPEYEPSEAVAREEAIPLDDLVASYDEGVAKTFTYLIKDINRTKEKVDSKRNATWYALQICQITLIVLGAVATAMVAVGNKLPYIAPWVIVPTTLVTIISGINAFYDYGGSYNRLSELRSSLAELEGRIIFDLAVDGVRPEDTRIAQKEMADYLVGAHAQLHAILNSHEQGRQLKDPPQVRAAAAAGN